MKFNFVVLGATGMQGKIVTRDLAVNSYSILMCGRDKSRIFNLLKKFKMTKFQSFDARNMKETASIIKKSGADVVVNCVEGDWNLEILEACIRAKANLVDLGSDIPITKKQFKLSNNLKEKNLLCITGAGSVPGIGNVMLRYAYNKFDEIDKIDVGFAWDSNLKKFVVPFSIQSITEEFYFPADEIINHKHITVKPMNTIVKDYHHSIGREKIFNVGHHPETFTFYEYCKNRGIKDIKFFAGFPDHSFDTIKSFIDLGFAEKKVVDYQKSKIIPVQFLTEILKKIKISKNYKEIENLWVDIYGKKNEKDKHIKMECIVPTLKGWEDAGCNIDTGMPASIMAQMIKKGIIKEKGCYSPEFLIPVGSFFKELRKRKMIVYENGKVIN